MAHNRVISTQATPRLKKIDSQTTICKILLPKFNTWRQVHLERKNGFEVPPGSTVSGFFLKNRCRYGAIALPLRCNRVAVTP